MFAKLQNCKIKSNQLQSEAISCPITLWSVSPTHLNLSQRSDEINQLETLESSFFYKEKPSWILIGEF